MIDYYKIVAALFTEDHFALRCLIQDALDSIPDISDWPEPTNKDPLQKAALAAITDLLASYRGQMAPAWTATVEPLQEPHYLMSSLSGMKNLRLLCETQSPEQLRRKGFLAPPGFLQFA